MDIVPFYGLLKDHVAKSNTKEQRPCSNKTACNFKKQLKLKHRTLLHNTPGATQLILYVGRGGVSGISINYEHQACQIRNLNIFFFNFKLSALKGMERGTNNI